jgi:hypothetical protein
MFIFILIDNYFNNNKNTYQYHKNEHRLLESSFFPSPKIFSKFKNHLLSKVEKKSLYLGFKRGYDIPILPEVIFKFYNIIYIRILRVIGGLCLFIVLTKIHLILPTYLHFPIIIIGFLQSLQICIIFMIKICYGLYTLIYKKKLFEVRNSPLNRYATHIANIVYCAKWGCAITGGTAGFLGAGIIFDTTLEASGRPKIFLPLVGKAYKTVFGEQPSSIEDKIYKSFGLENKSGTSNETSVTDLIDKYHSSLRQSDNDKKAFMDEIKSESNKFIDQNKNK